MVNRFNSLMTQAYLSQLYLSLRGLSSVKVILIFRGFTLPLSCISPSFQQWASPGHSFILGMGTYSSLGHFWSPFDRLTMQIQRRVLLQKRGCQVFRIRWHIRSERKVSKSVSLFLSTEKSPQIATNDRLLSLNRGPRSDICQLLNANNLRVDTWKWLVLQ